MTIEQIVEIPADRHVYFDFLAPNDIPAGPARVALKVIPFTKNDVKADTPPKFRISKKELDELMQNAHTPLSDSLTGILAHLGDITAEQIREERLAKYLK